MTRFGLVFALATLCLVFFARPSLSQGGGWGRGLGPGRGGMGRGGMMGGGGEGGTMGGGAGWGGRGGGMMGGGGGWGGGGGMMGGGGTNCNSDVSCGFCNGGGCRDMPVIHSLLNSRDAISRSVNETSAGVIARTWSDDPKVAGWIKEHVAAMKARVENYDPIRMRDPLFASVFQHASDFHMEVEYLDDGVKVVENGATPCTKALAKAHAKVVTGFIEKGYEEMWANHEVPKACSSSSSRGTDESTISTGEESVLSLASG